jgi:hypothetical protein
MLNVYVPAVNVVIDKAIENSVSVAVTALPAAVAEAAGELAHDPRG